MMAIQVEDAWPSALMAEKFTTSQILEYSMRGKCLLLVSITEVHGYTQTHTHTFCSKLIQVKENIESPLSTIVSINDFQTVYQHRGWDTRVD